MSRKKLIVTAIVLTLILAIGGILAYFTSTDTKVNRFKMSNVGITVDEGDFPGNTADENNTVPVVPNEEIVKAPTVTNEGDGDVYAFIRVEIPCKEVKTSPTGSATEIPLFTVRHITDATTGATADGIDSTNWVQVGEATKVGSNMVYVYAYGTSTKLTALSKNERTEPVFDKVKFAGVIETGDEDETDSLQGQKLEVTVSGYGIQTEGLESDVPSAVWPLVVNQYQLDN